MKKFNFCKFTGLYPATLIKTEHFHRFILFRLALIQNSCFVEDLPVSAYKSIKIDILFNIKERHEIHPVK